MRVMVVEDSPLIRQLIVELVSQEEGMTVVAALPSETDMVGAIGQFAPDALIYTAPRGDGQHVDVVRQVKRLSPKSRVLVLYNDPCPECGRRCLAAGAEAFLDKTSEFDRILDVLNGTEEARR